MHRITAIDASHGQSRFAHDVNALLSQNNPGTYDMLALLDKRSDSFSALHNELVQHYFDEQPGEPATCASAVAQLVDRVIDIMQQDLARAA